MFYPGFGKPYQERIEAWALARQTESDEPDTDPLRGDAGR